MVRTGLDEYIDSLRGRAPLSVEEERALAKEFGQEWDEYSRHVKMPWL